jgi:transcriptional regulator
MYLPAHFSELDRNAALALIHEYPFATLMSQSEGEPFINHLPLLLRDDSTLVGHLSRHNPQWHHMQSGDLLTLVFHGPHTYITPSWYKSREVPTWNYAVVHTRVKPRLIEDFKGIVQVLHAMTERFESTEPKPWRMALPEDLQNPGDLTSAIVAFELNIESISAKFKLSQNRSEADRSGVRARLETRKDEMSGKVREMMSR